MVARGLCASRQEAVSLIDAGLVRVAGAPADKAARLVDAGEPIEVVRARQWVGRGAEKLDHALTYWQVPLDGRSVLDAGSSTGGFTQCVLHHGASRVWAVDVGRHQLHELLRADPRVTVNEGINIRHLTHSDAPYPISLVVADLSFISLTTVIPALVDIAQGEDGFADREMILLVKPQFEVGRKEASRARGVITDPSLHQSAVKAVTDAVLAEGWTVVGVEESPIKGGEGNTEFLLYAKSPRRSAD